MLVCTAMVAFGAMGGEPTELGHESEEAARRARDNPLDPYKPDNALNHTMFYLVMAQDNAKGSIRLNTNFLDPNGRIEIRWDGAGSQPIFTLELKGSGDALFNGPFGYRAQYLLGPNIGLAANAALLAALAVVARLDRGLVKVHHPLGHGP